MGLFRRISMGQFTFALFAAFTTLLAAVAGCDSSSSSSSRSSAVKETAGGSEITAETKSTAKDPNMAKTETATFGAGCFWGVESTFRKVPGVVKTEVGYAGGKTQKPTYRDVCTDQTGHAEVVRVQYDPQKVTYQKLLEVFFENHDPTTMNSQGPDFGTQYRSVVFFNSPEQEKEARAEKQKRDASGEYVRPIATQIVAAGPFWTAEDYHQQYFEK